MHSKAFGRAHFTFRRQLSQSAIRNMHPQTHSEQDQARRSTPIPAWSICLTGRPRPVDVIFTEKHPALRMKSAMGGPQCRPFWSSISWIHRDWNQRSTPGFLREASIADRPAVVMGGPFALGPAGRTWTGASWQFRSIAICGTLHSVLWNTLENPWAG